MLSASHGDNHPTQRNLRRLVLLRGVSIAMQVLLIGVAVQWSKLSLPLGPLTVVLSTYGIWNLFTAWRARQVSDISDNEFFVQLVADVLALTGVLYFVGGATNPFAWFYLLPLVIAATLLPKHRVWTVAVLTVACYSLLVRYHQPLASATTNHDSNFIQHVFGMWFGFVLSAGLVAYFVTTITNTLRDRDQILAAAREQALRDERLVALGTLAAGAAHELGTPLGTMAIVSDELIQDYPIDKDAGLHERLLIMREQIDRCKNALSVISASAGEQRADAGQALPVDRYLQDLLSQWQEERPGITLQQQLNGTQPAPQLVADRALDQALVNILNNAADASPKWVSISAQWTKQTLIIEIRDRGAGLTEAAKSHHLGKTLYSDKEHGLGLGLFLAHSVIDRLGGTVTLFNVCADKKSDTDENKPLGTCTRIALPLSGV